MFNEEEKQRLCEFFNLLWEIDLREQERQVRLVDEPNGFAVENTQTCRECGYYTDTGWYTATGILCPTCRKDTA